MVAYYINANGEKLDLMKAPYRVVEADWYDSDWEESSDGYEKTVKIDVFGKKDEFVVNMEHLYKIFGSDSENSSFGKLYVNGTYLRCRSNRMKYTGWKGYVYSVVEITLYAPKLEWTEELLFSFYQQESEQTNDGLNFSFDFPFNFTLEKKGYKAVDVDNVSPNDFILRIYGPCLNPQILINGYPYEMYCSLEANEYLEIDSINYTIIKYLSNGTTSNLWNERGLEYSVFEKIPSGSLIINWSGDFGFDLVLFVKRRSARW